ncbi:hypothetical protein [Blastococcus sp. URHD0036]|uniref:hypothetical protein n=1 Tax=Blastococcus sp. URHD0036 TaxID=1380356 RepID=UPI0004956B42|nr:hypothetical protein [Blastococcus sp. URHD0036]
MTATPTALRPAAARPSAAVLAARGVFGVVGAVKLAATTAFTFFVPAEDGGAPQNAGDWVVVAWSAGLALAFLWLAVRFDVRDRRIVRGAVALLGAEVGFSLVKLTVYDETAPLVFMAVDLVLLGLIALARRARR